MRYTQSGMVEGTWDAGSRSSGFSRWQYLPLYTYTPPGGVCECGRMGLSTVCHIADRVGRGLHRWTGSVAGCGIRRCCASGAHSRTVLARTGHGQCGPRRAPGRRHRPEVERGDPRSTRHAATPTSSPRTSPTAGHPSTRRRRARRPPTTAFLPTEQRGPKWARG